MRNSPKTGFIKLDDETTVAGIILTADYCSEHEWGIKRMQRRFGIDTTTIKEQVENGALVTDIKLGYERLTNKEAAFSVFENTKYIYLCVMDTYMAMKLEEMEDKKERTKFLNRNLPIYLEEKDGLIGAWDESTFMVRMAKNKENRVIVDSFLKAEESNSLAIYIGKPETPAFSNGGLMIVNTSVLPEEVIDRIANEDQEYLNLMQTVASIGIEEKLAKAECKYYALSPRVISAEKAEELGTRYHVEFWLNPMDQRNNDFGWVTVEDLEDWISGTGKIPKKNEAV
jgi:hypothetical protein